MIVIEQQVTDAMRYWEAQHILEHGPSDRITLPKTVAKLADLLGAMWYAGEEQAEIPDTSEVARLIRTANAEAPSNITAAGIPPSASST